MINVNINSISCQLLFSTVRIVGTKRGGVTSTGTAFFFDFTHPEEGKVMPVLVANRHVIKDCESGSFSLHEATPDGKYSAGPFEITLDNFEKRWIEHPNGIDLCVMPIAPLLHAAIQQKKPIFRRSLGEDFIPTQESLSALNALEDVIMTGSPIGLWDKANNLPLFRKGITATHPAVDFNDQPEGLVDIAAFPGSSGSPVAILNEAFYKSSDGSITMGPRVIFLGILCKRPRLKADGHLEIVQIPTTQTPFNHAVIPVHVGIYIKSRELLHFKEMLLKMG